MKEGIIMIKKVKDLQKPRRNQDTMNVWTDSYKHNRFMTIIHRAGNKYNDPKKIKYANTVVKFTKESFDMFFEKYYYEIEGCIMEFDKDIKYFGVQGFENIDEYSEETCIVVPKAINVLFEQYMRSIHSPNIKTYKTKPNTWYVSNVFGKYHFTGESREEVVIQIAEAYNERLKELMKIYGQHMTEYVRNIVESKDFTKVLN